jgi:hypothetical protein
MKLRPHPGTTILFCAIKENPRRKNCRLRIKLVQPRQTGLTGVSLDEAISGRMRAVAPGQQKKKALK